MANEPRKELYRSPNGDAWYLMRDPRTRQAFVRHKPNVASGGKESDSEIGDFLMPGAGGPEHQSLLRLIGTLVEPDRAPAS